MTMTVDGNVIKLRGLVRWASIPPADPKKPHEDAYNPKEPDNCFYSIEVECSEDEHKEILALIGKKPGDPFAQQLRKYDQDVLHKSTGEVMAAKTDKKFLTVKKTKLKGTFDFGILPVKDARGNTITDVGVGNDSTAIVHIVVEPVKKGSAKKTIRLKGVQVIDLKPFTLGNAKEEIDLEVIENNNLNEQQNQQAASADTEEFGF